MQIQVLRVKREREIANTCVVRCFYFKLGGHRRLFWLFAIYLCKDPISKHGHFKRYWVLGLYHMNLEGHSSNHTYVTCCCSVTQSRPTLCNPMDCSTPGFPVLHYLLEFAQTHAHQVYDAIQPTHPLSPPSTPALNLSQHQGLYQRVSSSYQVA